MIMVARDSVKTSFDSNVQNLTQYLTITFSTIETSTIATIPYFANSDQQEFPIIAECLTISDNCGTGGSRGALL